MEPGMKVYVFLFLCCLLIGKIITLPPTIDQALIKHLFANYSPMYLPVVDRSKSVNVTFNMRLLQIQAVDEINQNIKVQCYLQTSWINEYLKWQPLEWGNLTSLIVPREKVWTPDIVLMNIVDTGDYTIQAYTDLVLIHSNGFHYWQPKILLTASFLADIRVFPFDMQNFTFIYSSWTFAVEQLRITKSDDAMIDTMYVKSSQWELLDTEKVVAVFADVDAVNNTYFRSDARFAYTFIRKPAFYLITLVAPCTILIFIWLFSYYLPADSGERMGVIITILLAFAVFLEVVAFSLPHNAHSTPLFSIYIILVICVCSLSFFFTCIVIFLMQKGGGKDPPPHWVMTYIKGEGKKQTVSYKKNTVVSLSDVECPKEAMTPKHKRNPDVENTSISRMSVVCSKLRRKRPLEKQSKQLKSISNMLKILTKTVKDAEKQEDIRSEWTLLAELLDRISFWFILIIFVLSHIPLIAAYKKYY